MKPDESFEKDLNDILKQQKVKQPPASDLQNFEQDVFKKIKKTKPPMLGFPIWVPALGLALIAAGWFLLPQFFRPSPEKNRTREATPCRDRGVARGGIF